MASNIKVVLEIDNKKYLADIRDADRATKDFAATTKALGSGSAGFVKLSSAVDTVHRKMMSLKTLVAGALFAGLGQSAIQMADELQDLSNATGIATGRLLEFKKALTVSGGEADQMPTAINAFVRSIDEAAQGGLKAQNSFRDLGISLKDLAQLSEQDLLEQTLQGIAAIEDPARRAALMMDKFGKSFKTVDPGELLAKLRETRGEGDKYAASIKRAAELQDAFATAQGNLKLAFLEAFSPAINMVNDFNNRVTEGTAKMDGLIAAIKIAGVALVTAFSSSVLLGFVASIGVVLRGISAIGVALGATALPAWLIAASGAAARFLPALRAIALLFSAGLGIYAATQLFDNFGDIATNALSRVTEALGRLAGEILNLPTDAIAALMNLMGANITNAVGLGTPFLIAAENAKKAREEAEKLAKYSKQVGGGRGTFGMPQATPGEGVAVATGAGVLGSTEVIKPIRDVTDALAQRRKEIELSAQAFSRQNAQIIDSINFENTLIGKTEDQVAVLKAVEDVYQRAGQEAQKLRDAKAGLTKDEAGLAATYDKQIALIQQQAEADAQRVRRATENANGLKMIEAARLKDLENLTKAMEQQARIQEALTGARLSIIGQKQDVTFQGQTQGMSPFEKQMAQIKEDSRKAALEAGRAFAAAFEDTGDGMTPEKAKEFADGLDAIAKGYADIADMQLKNLEASRTWEAGWKEAFANYKDSAQNAAEQSRTYFETFSKGFEDAIVRFVTTGKLSFKDLANSLIADFARIQAKKMLTGLFDMGGGGIGGIFGGIAKIFGFANGGNPPVGVPSIVGEKGPELFVPRNAGTIIPNNMLGGGVNQTSVTYNIQAVDAQSFKSMVARDPQFLYAVTEQGRRSLPGRR